jgi:hypothetical protein
MSNHDITRLIVGEPFPVKLGSPVTQGGISGELPEGSTLRWVDGRWESKAGAKSLGQSLGAFKLPAKNSIRLQATRPTWLRLPSGKAARFLAELAIIFAVGLPVTLYFARQPATVPTSLPREAPKDLPLEPREAGGNGIIREVDASYVMPSSDVPVGNAQSNSVTPTPVQPAQIARPGPAARVVVPSIPAQSEVPVGAPSPSPSPAAQAPQQVQGTRDDKKAPAGGAVILDEEIKREPPQTKPAAQLPPALEQKKEAVRDPAKVGLVAITQDSKTALFTDPKTRLPTQYKVGERLPSGETVKAIDAKAGKVTTDIKTYTLE